MSTPSISRKRNCHSTNSKSVFKCQRRKKNHHAWLNARIVAKDLYLKNDFKRIGVAFEIDPIGLHQRFIKNTQ